jgi:hypothetical protein
MSTTPEATPAAGTPEDDGTKKSAGQAALESGRLTVGDKAESGAFEIGADGKPKVIDGTDAALDLSPQPEGDETPADDTTAPPEKPEETPPEEPAPSGPEDLGEYKADDPETVAKFDKRFTTEEGTLNEKAIGEEFWGDYINLSPEDREKADLRPATRAYLKDTYKVSDAFIDQTRDGLVALQVKQDGEFMEAFGGKETVVSALEWAKSGGYTEAQRTRFNELQVAGGDGFKEAVELLISRHKAAAPAGTTPAVTPGRRSTPERNVTANATPGSTANAGVFPTKADYQEAWTKGLQAEKAARRNKVQDPEAWKKADAHVTELRKKGRKSAPFWK